MSFVREYPPSRLSVALETPAGRTARWGVDEHDPRQSFSGLRISDTMPGGFEHCDCVLTRDPQLDYPDLAELETLTVHGAGGQVAWQGRLETAPRTSGDRWQITPAAVGWQSHLTDDSSAREIYAELGLTGWQAASVQRKINLAAAGTDVEDASTQVDPGTGRPALDTTLVGPWARERVSEAWYDAKGIALGRLEYAWKTRSAGNIGNDVTTDAHWHWHALLLSDDVASAYDDSGDLRAAGPGSGTVTASTTTRRWALVQLDFDLPGGTDGVSYDLWWTSLALYGTHGLPLYTSLDGTLGVLASDVIEHAIGKWAPRLQTSRQGQPTITPSTFVIPQLAFLDPTNAAAIVKAAVRFGLPDWAVWDDRVFWCYPRGQTPPARSWRARVGPSQLQQAGPQIDRLHNGVIVTFTDESGVARTVGPPGSGAGVEDASLIDPDPQNPCNQFSPLLRRWAPLSMGTSTAQGAIKVGTTFLSEQRQLDRAGQATLTGYVEDDKGVYWPAWTPRAGDSISFVDAQDPSPRRIVQKDYTDDSRVCQVTLEQPPDSLQALLERLQVVLTPITGGG